MALTLPDIRFSWKIPIKLIPPNQGKGNSKFIFNTHIQCQSKASQQIFFTFINFLHHIFAEIIDWTWNSNRSLQFNFACKIVHTHMIAINENKQNQLLCGRRIFFFPFLDYFFYIFFLLRVKKEKISFLYW